MNEAPNQDILKLYSKEELGYGRIDFKDEDHENMNEPVLEAKEILASKQQQNDQKKTDASNYLRKRQEGKIIFNYGQELKLLQPFHFSNKENLLNESKDVYTNVDKGSMEEMFFTVLEEKFPLLMISLSDDVKFSDETPAKNFIAIKTQPYKTDRDLIFDLSKNKIIKLMTETWGMPDEEIERELIKNKTLSPETIQAIRAKCCQQEINKARDAVREENLRSGIDPQQSDWKKREEGFQEYLERIKAKPITDESLKNIIEEAVDTEYKNILKREQEAEEEN